MRSSYMSAKAAALDYGLHSVWKLELNCMHGAWFRPVYTVPRILAW